jgi:hypothetical protein
LCLCTVEFCTHNTIVIMALWHLNSRSLPSPKPLVVSGSTSWYGNDGNWSTIPIYVGSSKQEFQMLVSITSANTSIPFSDFCSQSNITNCGLDRGVSHSDGFLPANSTTWNASPTQWQGFDTVDLSHFGGPSLDQQPILGITTAIPFLASLGLPS